MNPPGSNRRKGYPCTAHRARWAVPIGLLWLILARVGLVCVGRPLGDVCRWFAELAHLPAGRAVVMVRAILGSA